MEGTYTLNDLGLMTGFTTRTLRTYLAQGLLKGEKANGVWRFTPDDLDRFFSEPFVKEGLRIKRSSVVFDFLADRSKKAARTCVILDLPQPMTEGRKVSDFFCRQMKDAKDVVFKFDWDDGQTRVILSGAAEQVARIMEAYRGSIGETEN